MDLIILDRDGVINKESDAYVKSPAEWIPLPGSLEAIAQLNQAGYRVVVATNQSGVARGLLDLTTLARIHQKLRRQVAEVGGIIDAVLFCPHGSGDNCNCRKPKAGMLLDLRERLHVSLERVPAVGDSLRDIRAAQAVGCRPILVQTGKGASTLEAGVGLEGVEVYSDLASVAETLLAERELPA